MDRELNYYDFKHIEKKETILEEAQRITDGSRNESYGEPEDNFQQIADYWNPYLDHHGVACKLLTPKMVAIMMVLMKLAREDFKPSRDNRVDACGYLRCSDKIEGGS